MKLNIVVNIRSPCLVTIDFFTDSDKSPFLCINQTSADTPTLPSLYIVVRVEAELLRVVSSSTFSLYLYDDSLQLYVDDT